jgi:glycosyl-4,4'-diaponeurosporenoate acyltransferase
MDTKLYNYFRSDFIFNLEKSVILIVRYMKILYCVVYLAFIGIVSNFIGDTFKRENFNYTRFPFATFSFERGGKFYEIFKIKKWKDILPDMSKIRSSMVKKKVTKYRDVSQFDSLAREACVAELVHFLLIIFAIPCFFLGGTLWGTVCFLVWTIGNIPFIMIQRYNRARIIIFLDKLEDYNKK